MTCSAVEKDFRFWMPMETVKSNKGDMRIGGIATDEDAQDIQGEKLFVEGLDIGYLLQRGAFNWDHGKGPGDILGEVDIAQKQGSKLYVEGPLYPHVKQAKEVYDLMRSLKEAGSKRKLGLSVEGKIKERDSETGKNIKKAWIKNVAITYNPINQGTWVDMIKSLGSFSFSQCTKGDCENCSFCEDDVDKSVSSEVGEKEPKPTVIEVARVSKSDSVDPSFPPVQEPVAPVLDKSQGPTSEEFINDTEKALAAGHDIPAVTGGISGSAVRKEHLEGDEKITTYNKVGEEAKEHKKMIEEAKKVARKKQGEFTKSELVNYLQTERNYPERLAGIMTDLIFKAIQVAGYMRNTKGHLSGVKSHPRQLSHEAHRLATMSEKALMTRAAKISHPDKMLHFYASAKSAGMSDLAAVIKHEGRRRLGLSEKDFNDVHQEVGREKAMNPFS
jgi:hypothetical protein